MPTIKNVRTVEELMKELTKNIQVAMTTVAREGMKTVKEHVQEEVYDANKPKYYKRKLTRGKNLLSSVSRDVYTVGNFTTVKIYHDPEKMALIPPSAANNWMGNHHSAINRKTGGAYYQPLDFRAYLPNAINDGTSGKIYGEGYWTKPRPYFDNAREEVNAGFRDNLKNNLITRGLTVV